MDSPTGKPVKSRVYSTASMGAQSGWSVRSAAVSVVSGFIEDVACITEHSHGRRTQSRRSGVARPVSSAAITFNMLQSAMGTGVLSLAVVFDKSGSVVGSVILVVIGLVAYMSVWLLLNAVLLLEAHVPVAPAPAPRASKQGEREGLLADGGETYGAAGALKVEEASQPVAKSTSRSCLVSPQTQKIGKRSTTIVDVDGEARNGSGVLEREDSKIDIDVVRGGRSKQDPADDAAPRLAEHTVVTEHVEVDADADDDASSQPPASIHTFEALAERCFGRPGRLAAQIIIIAMCMVALVAFLVPLKAFLHLIFSTFPWYVDAGGTPNICLLAVIALVIAPLCTLRQVGKLWVSSLLGVVMILFFVIATSVLTINDNVVHHPEHQKICHALDTDNNASDPTVGGVFVTYPPKARNFANWDTLEILSALGIVVSSYICHLTLFPIFEETASVEGTQVAAAKIKKCAGVAMVVICVIYLAAAWSGYTAWGSQNSRASSVLACYSPDEPLILALYIGISMTAVSAFPLALLSCRQTIALMMFGRGNSETSSLEHLGLTLVIIVFGGGIAMAAQTLSSVLGVGGAFVSPPLIFLLPALCYLRASTLAEKRLAKLEGQDFIGQDAEAEELRANNRPVPAARIAAWGVLISGVFVQVSAIFASLYTL